MFKLDPRENVNEKAPSGNTPLHAAINTGNINMVKLLINAGANVNAWNPECEGATPLHLAIMSGKYCLLKLCEFNSSGVNLDCWEHNEELLSELGVIIY